jgi:hypothetical protein
MIKILIGILLLTLAFLIPVYYFNTLLAFFVGKVSLGWVLSTILVRLLVIILVLLALTSFKKSSARLSKIKQWIVVAVAFPVGFGISFISPIYTVDYGMFNDGVQLQNLSALEQEMNGEVLTGEGSSLVAFFTSGCPHCMAASYRLGLNIESGQKVPVHAIFPGTEEDTKEFIENNNGSAFNVHRIQNDSLFIAISGGTFPSLFLLDKNGKTTHHWVGDELNYSALDYLKSLEQ